MNTLRGQLNALLNALRGQLHALHGQLNALLNALRGRRRLAALAVLAAGLVVVLGGVVVDLATRSSATAAATGCAAPHAVKPTIVLVHGNWANAASWSGEVARLQRDGYVVRALNNPLRGLTSDAADVAAFLHTVSGPIVLVGHSYGGAVITNAAAGIPQVKALVYVDGFAPEVGEPVGQLLGTTSALRAAPTSLFDTVAAPGSPAGDTDLYLKEQVFLQSFAQDLPTATAQALWASQSPSAVSTGTTPSGAAAWKTIPSWFVVGSADKIIPPEAQLFMAHRAHARSIVTVAGGSHLTLISHPDAVTDQILAAAQAACTTK
jgi:pimeloyl-ACP methyl ester carboxylesterase